MQFLSQSPFLQALGYAIGNSLWQTALVWIAVVLLNSVKKSSSATRYSIAIAGQLVSFVWFMITLQFYYIKCSEQLISAGAIQSAPTFLGATDNQSWFWNITWKLEECLPYLSVAYLFLLCLLFGRFLKSYKTTRQISTNGLQKIDVQWKVFVKNMASRLSIKQEVGIFVSSIVNSPLTIGFLKPMILIPVASINHLTTEQMEAVILHELAHIKRADYLYNLLISVVEIALFFNPFTQLISRIIKKERENSCDDWVLQFQYNASMYAEALLQIAYLQKAPLLSMNATGKGDLLFRIKRIIQPAKQTFNYRQQLLALLLMTGIFSCIAWYEPLDHIHQKVSASSLMNSENEMSPLSMTIDNPFFSPLSLLPKPIKEERIKTVEKKQEKTVVTTSPNERLKDSAFKLFSQDNKLPFSVNLNQVFNEVMPQIHSEFSGIAWPKMIILPEIDSAAVNEQIRIAFEKAKTDIDWKKINEDIANAKKQISQLRERQLVVFENNLKISDRLNAALDKLERFSDLELSGLDFSRQVDDMVSKQMLLQLNAEKKNQQKQRKADDRQEPKVLLYTPSGDYPETISPSKLLRLRPAPPAPAEKPYPAKDHRTKNELLRQPQDSPAPAFVFIDKNSSAISMEPSQVFLQIKDNQQGSLPLQQKGAPTKDGDHHHIRITVEVL